MILEAVLAAAISGNDDRPASLVLGDRPASVAGADADSYFAWLSERMDRVTEEWRRDGCEVRVISYLEPVVWPVSETPSYMREHATGDVILVERAVVDGCGTASTQNLGVFAGADGRRWSVSLLQGDFRASPREATSRVGEAVGVALEHFDPRVCPRDEAHRTLRVDPVTLPWGPGSPTSWSELWPVSICGVVLPVRMDFERSTDGTVSSQARWAE